MSSRPFVRQLGAQPGVQLLPLIDSSEAVGQGDVADQTFGMIARLTRGRTDAPFVVNRGNFFAATGAAQSIRANALNEARVQAFEALNNGAASAVVRRLVATDAATKVGLLKFGRDAVLAVTVTAGVVTAVAVSTAGTGYQTGQRVEVIGTGTGAIGTVTADPGTGAITAVAVDAGGTGYGASGTTARVSNTISFTTSATIPGSGWDIAVAHRDNWNDGIIIGLHADSTPLGGVASANEVVHFRMIDPETGAVRYEVTGSLNSAAVDEQGASYYLPDVVANATGGELTLTVNAGLSALPADGWYGRSADGSDRWNDSAPLILFTEGTLTYAPADLDAAVASLEASSVPFSYVISGGSQSAPLLARLAAMAVRTNTILIVDLDGKLAPASAITLSNQLGLDSHLIHVYYGPISAFEPLAGYRETWGFGGLQVGLRCARNAAKNAKGFAPLQYPIAGPEHPVQRQQMAQTRTLSDADLSDLARARINPVGFGFYSGGGRYVFLDSLTSASVSTSFRKHIAVAEMSTRVDLDLATYAKGLIQLPMADALRRMEAFIDRYLTDAVTSGWLVPSQNLPNGAPFAYSVTRDSVSRDVFRVEYSLSFDGTARQVVLQQRLVR